MNDPAVEGWTEALDNATAPDNPVMVLIRAANAGAEPNVRRWAMLWCPGCAAHHQFVVRDPEHPEPSGPVWTWDGNEEAPTFSPSMLLQGGPEGPDAVCHSFVVGGRWQYLSDCTHALAGQTVDLPPVPDWIRSLSP